MPLILERVVANADAIHAVASARALTVEQLAARLDASLVAAGIVPPPQQPPSAGRLVARVEHALHAGAPVPIIVVDGLDEAGKDAYASPAPGSGVLGSGIVPQLLLPLAARAVIIVATRDAVPQGAGASLVELLQPAGHVDLVIETELKPHDVLALIPIIAGAGGIMTTWENGSPAAGGRIIAAGDKRVHAEALSVLRNR